MSTMMYDDKDIERIMEIAEEEIERTSQEAVKAVLEDVGGAIVTSIVFALLRGFCK